MVFEDEDNAEGFWPTALVVVVASFATATAAGTAAAAAAREVVAGVGIGEEQEPSSVEQELDFRAAFLTAALIFSAHAIASGATT